MFNGLRIFATVTAIGFIASSYAVLAVLAAAFAPQPDSVTLYDMTYWTAIIGLGLGIPVVGIAASRQIVREGASTDGEAA